MPHFAASDQVLHCLLMSHKKPARLIWVNNLDENPLKGTVENIADLSARIKEASISKTEIFWNSNL